MKRLAQWMIAMVLALGFGAAQAGDLNLGPGDVIKISVYGSPDLGLDTRVSEAGSITFPLIGNVPVGGLSVSDAERKIADMLVGGGFLRKAEVNIIVTALQSQQVSVLGQVNRPGRYPLDGKRSILDFLALAGGMNPDGADSISLIRKRNGVTTKETVDVVEMIRTGNVDRDLELAPNDVIFVERAPRFYIYGEVQRPGAFKLERGMTVLQALAAGGGLTARGTERGLRVKRRGADGQLQTISVKQDDVLQVDDVVYVQESWF